MLDISSFRELGLILSSLEESLIALKTNRITKCTCTGITLQYEGKCVCEKGKNEQFYKDKLAASLNAIVPGSITKEDL